MAEKKGKVKFIRVRGRVVPIRDNGKGPSDKPTSHKGRSINRTTLNRRANAKTRLKKVYKKKKFLSNTITGGILGGLTGALLKKSKVGALLGGTLALSSTLLKKKKVDRMESISRYSDRSLKRSNKMARSFRRRGIKVKENDRFEGDTGINY